MNIVLFLVGHGFVLYFLMTTDDTTFLVEHGALLPWVVNIVCIIAFIFISYAANERGAMKRLNSFLASHFADWKERGIIVQVSTLTVRSRGGSSTHTCFRWLYARAAAPQHHSWIRTPWRRQLRIHPWQLHWSIFQRIRTIHHWHLLLCHHRRLQCRHNLREQSATHG